jgi:hypothetical protein
VTSAAPSIDEDEPDTVTSVKVDDGNAGSEMEPVRTPVETETTSDPGSTVAARRNIATAVIIGSIIVAAFVISNQTTKPQIEGDTISQAFSQAAPCATASIALAVPSGADPATTAETLFAALGAVGGVDKATYNFKTSTLEVGFCESKTTEEGVRRGLAPTGLVEAVVPPS